MICVFTARRLFVSAGLMKRARSTGTISRASSSGSTPLAKELEAAVTLTDDATIKKPRAPRKKKLSLAESVIAALGEAAPHPYAGRSHWVGYHASGAGGLYHAVLNARAAHARAFAFFTRARGSWKAPALQEQDATRFREACQLHGYGPQHILPHSSYLINCGSGDVAGTRAKSLAALIDEARRCVRLGIVCLNFHPGSCSGVVDPVTADEQSASMEAGAAATGTAIPAGEAPLVVSPAAAAFLVATAEAVNAVPFRFASIDDALAAAPDCSPARAAGIRNVASAINAIHTAVPGIILVIELMAGGGGILGRNFPEIAAMIAGVADKPRVGVCIDTAHAHGAGMDMRTPEAFAALMRSFDEAVGLRFLRGMHLNDSAAALGSAKDRHHHIGRGAVGLAGFRALMRDPRTAGVPLILETPTPPGPGGNDAAAWLPKYASEIELLYSLDGEGEGQREGGHDAASVAGRAIAETGAAGSSAGSSAAATISCGGSSAAAILAGGAGAPFCCGGAGAAIAALAAQAATTSAAAAANKARGAKGRGKGKGKDSDAAEAETETGAAEGDNKDASATTTAAAGAGAGAGVVRSRETDTPALGGAGAGMSAADADAAASNGKSGSSSNGSTSSGSSTAFTPYDEFTTALAPLTAASASILRALPAPAVLAGPKKAKAAARSRSAPAAAGGGKAKRQRSSGGGGGVGDDEEAEGDDADGEAGGPLDQGDDSSDVEADGDDDDDDDDDDE